MFQDGDKTIENVSKTIPLGNLSLRSNRLKGNIILGNYGVSFVLKSYIKSEKFYYKTFIKYLINKDGTAKFKISNMYYTLISLKNNKFINLYNHWTVTFYVTSLHFIQNF